ncbi:hypothetical protein JW835_14930 [bacterium]|nr:hypothetical protein [bacterium]
MIRVLSLFFMIPFFLNAQQICGFLNNSVIIENGEYIGNAGDEKSIIRQSYSGQIKVGMIRIEERFEDMVIATVIDVEPGCQITVGDRIASREWPMISNLTKENKLSGNSPQNNYQQNDHNGSDVDFRRLRMGVSLGTLLPYQTLHQRTNYSYQAGAVFQYGFTPRSSLMFDLMYSFMDEQSRPKNAPDLNNQSVLNVNALFRQGVYHSIFMDLGAGVYVPNLSITASTDQREVNSLEYHYGVCAGLAINFIRSNALSMFLNPRYHTYLMRDKMIENVSVGMNLIL